mmetsp:Transcript_24322/g.52984  ORF Transcript_24322/g.52984 Transcript_24322/m.52984 type:complete len:128 (+) Transcript_24322:40-423(+)
MHRRALNTWCKCNPDAIKYAMECLVQHRHVHKIWFLMCCVGIWVFRRMPEVDGKRVLAETIIRDLYGCSKTGRSHACHSLKKLAQNCQDSGLADQCIEVLRALKRRHPQEGIVEAALVAWTLRSLSL